MPILELEDVELFYARAGDGPPLLLIGGLASDHASWGPVIAPLAERFTLFMPDNRGAGQTRPVDAVVSIEAIAGDIAALIAALGLDRVDVVGHSLGGAIACRLAADRPELVRRVIVAAGGARMPARVAALLEDLVRLRRLGDEILFYRLFFQWLFRDSFFADAQVVDDAARMAAAYPHRVTAEGFEAQVRAALAFDAEGLLGSIDAPVLVLSGGADRLFGAADVAAFSAAPNVAFAEIPGAGHSLHWDDPTAFVDAVVRFLRR